MAELKHMQLKGRTSYAKWWPQVKWKARFDGVWNLVDPDGPDAPAYNNSPPTPPPTINELKAKLDVKRASAHQTAMSEWDARRPEGGEPDPNTKPKAPLPATFEDVQEEHTALIHDYTIASNVHKTRSEQQSRFLTWLTKTVDPDIWVATIAALHHESIQEILRSLKRQYAPSGTTVTSTVRDE